jgi:hypothetical protein
MKSWGAVLSRWGAACGLSLVLLIGHASGTSADEAAPSPLLRQGESVDWWFAFKFNGAVFPGCDGGTQRVCLFGGNAIPYPAYGQQFVYASSAAHSLQRGTGCAGDSVNDPLGATFEQIYDGNFNYVIWNDQFYDDPKIVGCSKNCGSPWAHSKGMVAWDNAGQGFVLQVTTPSWPAAGGKANPRRTDGNTLGCVKDNNVKVSQHFFALKIIHDDLTKILKALANASVVTDTQNAQIVKNGGPPDVQELVNQLGQKSDSRIAMKETLSNGIILISKPSKLHVPPWQMVSALLDGVPLRTATWWMTPKIYTTTASSRIDCWDSSLDDPGPVEIATTGQWTGHEFALTGGPGTNNNHAKVGVSTSRNDNYVIFGDMNQQGAVAGDNCGSSQNGRGGLFYVINDRPLADTVRALLKGDTAPTKPSATQ